MFALLKMFPPELEIIFLWYVNYKKNTFFCTRGFGHRSTGLVSLDWVAICPPGRVFFGFWQLHFLNLGPTGFHFSVPNFLKRGLPFFRPGRLNVLLFWLLFLTTCSQLSFLHGFLILFEGPRHFCFWAGGQLFQNLRPTFSKPVTKNFSAGLPFFIQVATYFCFFGSCF
jgi:hypothetical protein